MAAVLGLAFASGLTTEEVNAKIERAESGVYRLTEENFDDFVNWNKQVFICFHDKK